MKVRIVTGLIIAGLILLLFSFLWSRILRHNLLINTSGASVIKQLQALNRYETASYTIEKIIDAGTSGNRLQELLYGDRILLIAHGQIIAGFDLSTLTKENIKVDGKTVTLTLPPPQILLTKLDSEKTRVYDRRQGLLSAGDKDLESKARLEAEKSIKEVACEGNILSEASKNARNQLTALLKTLDFTTVIIEIPAGTC